MSKTIGALIPIRLASTRLPNKAILNICNKPIVHHLLDRVFASKYIDKKNVIVCTTTKKSDDELVEYVESYGANVFRGDPDDIIKRLYDAMTFYKLDYAIQVDGDDITVDPDYMDLCLTNLLNDPNLDVVSVNGLPIGISTKSFSYKAMQKVFERYETTNNDTGFGSYFTETDFCNYKSLNPISEKHIFDRLRLTLDYEEDFLLFETIFKKLYKYGEVFRLQQIIDLIKTEPQITEINYFLQEEYMNRWHEKRNINYKDNNGKIKSI